MKCEKEEGGWVCVHVRVRQGLECGADKEWVVASPSQDAKPELPPPSVLLADVMGRNPPTPACLPHPAHSSANHNAIECLIIYFHPPSFSQSLSSSYPRLLSLPRFSWHRSLYVSVNFAGVTVRWQCDALIWGDRFGTERMSACIFPCHRFLLLLLLDVCVWERAREKRMTPFWTPPWFSHNWTHMIREGGRDAALLPPFPIN